MFEIYFITKKLYEFYILHTLIEYIQSLGFRSRFSIGFYRLMIQRYRIKYIEMKLELSWKKHFISSQPKYILYIDGHWKWPNGLIDVACRRYSFK